MEDLAEALEAQEDLHSRQGKVDQGRGNSSKAESEQGVAGPHCRKRPKACCTRTSTRGCCSSSTLVGGLQPSIAVP